MTDGRWLASQMVDAALVETRTWSTAEVRAMMHDAVAAERERCAAIVRRFRLDEHADIMLREIENG